MLKTGSKNSLILLFFLAFALGSILGIKFINKNQESQRPRILINKQIIFVEIADTPQKAASGLSNRSSLPQDEGMLFVFEKTGSYNFWMKDMKFSLDFIFIKNDEIVDIAENVKYPLPKELPQQIFSGKLFDKVLEVNNGTVKKFNIKTGDRIQFLL